MNKNKEDGLYMPQNVKTRREYFEGFGTQELIYLIIAVAVSAVMAYIAHKYLALSLLKAMTVVLCVPTLVVFLTVKTETNISVWEQIKLLIKFQKSQKQYPYIALDEWEK